MRKTISIFLFLLTFIGLTGVRSSSASSIFNSPYISPSQLISAINNYRQEKGVHALSVNDTLMSLAQTQSNYQASIGTYSHTGPDGTTPTERAYAAGYGDGNKIFLSEIVYQGYQATIDDALSWWKSSSLHNRVMLDSQYIEIGAGISTDGDWTFFTAEIAWITTVSAPAKAGESSSNGGSKEAQDDSSPAPVYIIKATPNEDGSIIHVIQEGQTLWAIAAVYGIDLDVLVAQNNLTRTSLIFPGDKIVIHPATSSVATIEPNIEIKPQAISTAVSFVETKTPTLKVGETPTPTTITVSSEETLENPSVRWVIILAFAVIFIVIVGSLFFQKQPERFIDDDVVR